VLYDQYLHKILKICYIRGYFLALDNVSVFVKIHAGIFRCFCMVHGQNCIAHIVLCMYALHSEQLGFFNKGLAW